MSVLIAGGGIGGLALALTLHQIGVPARVFESVRELKPLGVGINLQPNAIRELYNLGISEADLNAVGIPSKEWSLVGQNGREIYAEPRGTFAGYNWPQYAVHRGRLQMMLYNKLLERAGTDAVQTDARVIGYRKNADRGVTARIVNANGDEREETGSLLIGVDGLHSAIRAQMYPDQPPIHWGGILMWRGVSRAKPVRTGSSFVGLGTIKQRMVIYPISDTDEDGFADINWVAEVTVDDPSGRDAGWFREASFDDFLHHFADWQFDWLDVPALIQGADKVYENPMIDREPIPNWQDGPVVLMGDAAHVMYPTGSNGGTQAIMDARILGAKFLEHGVNETALAAYNDALCKPVSELVLRNRSAGPFGLLQLVDERCGGIFENIDDIVTPAERADFMAKYKEAAGFDMDRVNNAPPTIPAGARMV